MKKFLIAASFGILLASCGGNTEETASEPGISPCECAELTNKAEKDTEALNQCIELRKNESFQKEYTKCVATMITGKSSDQVKIVSGNEASVVLPNDGTYIPTGNVVWSGKKITGSGHTGEIQVKDGNITISSGEITAATVVIDMSSIKNTDLEGDQAMKLEGHLKSDDFFGVETHPEATFEMTSAEFMENKAKVEGTLTIKGISKPAKATLVYSANGEDGIVVSGSMMFNRADFDVRYGSGTFFDDLGDDLIKDQVILKFNVKGKKSEAGV